MSDLTTIARPYAKAVFDFAVEESTKDENALDKWEGMLNFLSQLIQNETVQSFLVSANSAETLADGIISLCGEQLDQYGQNLVRLMAENERLAVLPTVYEEYKSYVEDYRSIADVYVTSAFALTEEQQQKIATAMEKRLARKINLNCSIDESLIGGCIIRTDDMVIDGSSRGQLQRLASDLQL
ncbi:ATP F0F1 synthase subunit delta [Actinobacillus delphinicola]|uniref:ATP synthase subunit delta n=1 Tax=Actinobacillus delphinicola TaxID=51161 RepID=A0A448TTF3_9PAST|nr:F0F1 ATP synthase subunit delta [Actinobacillus delphinicola]MDG6897491.1 ATP F0F1 synthase subunit delta [Actinobacillus delphinicola]VEJ09284.1 F0F1 ATP synthase subunit delta [Actinobacillus delphinicola]